MTNSLADLRVVELCEDLGAAYCARQFAAWGADVVVVEPPAGSPVRMFPPIVSDAGGKPASLVWEYVAANKRSLTLDDTDPPSRERLRSLVQSADVFVTDLPGPRLRGLALDHASLASSATNLVTVSITPFGSDGPYAELPASDLVLQALSGMLSLSGTPGRAPLKLAANVLPYACGVGAFVGALAALHERARSGRGQLVEVAGLEAIASLVLFLRAQYLGEPFPRRSGVGTMLVPCADGLVLCSPRFDRGWNDLLVALGIEPEMVPEPLRSMAGRQDDGLLLDFLSQHTRERSAKDVFESLGVLSVAGSLFQTPPQLLENEHLKARSYFQPLRQPRLGVLTFPGPAARMSETPPEPPAPAPAPAESYEDEWLVPREQHTEAHFARRSGRGTRKARPPLDGVRVLDLTGAWIGPYAAMLLADLGADVIKIEAPTRPDVWRFYGPVAAGRPQPTIARPGSSHWNTSHYFNSVNRNKRGLALDLTKARGKEMLLRLVEDADLLLENFTPRVMDNFGLGYEVLSQVNPGLVMVSFSGYGKTGPYRDFKANGATTETISGWVSLFGYPGEPPMLMGEMEADPICGLQMAAHALVALAHRERTAKGQSVDGSMFEAATGYVGEEVLLASLGREVSHPRGNRDRALAPQGVFPCVGRDEWLAITVRNDDDWRALLGVAADARWLQEPCFETAALRLGRAGELEEGLARWTKTRDARGLMTALGHAGVPAAVVLKTNEVPRDPHMVARGWFRPLTHADTGTNLHNGHLWRFSRSPLVWRLPPPRLGEHSEDVLIGDLGLTADEFQALLAAGVTAGLDADLAESEVAAATSP